MQMVLIVWVLLTGSSTQNCEKNACCNFLIIAVMHKAFISVMKMSQKIFFWFVFDFVCFFVLFCLFVGLFVCLFVFF